MGREIGAIEACALHTHYADDVTPLAVGDLAALAIPSQLLQKDVFGRMNVQDSAADVNPLRANC